MVLDLRFQTHDLLRQHLLHRRRELPAGGDDELVEVEGLLQHPHAVAGFRFLDPEVEFRTAVYLGLTHRAGFRLRIKMPPLLTAGPHRVPRWFKQQTIY